MSRTEQINGCQILHSECKEALKRLIQDGVQVDSIVTDPPYGIRFMGLAWDGQDIERQAAERMRYRQCPLPNGKERQKPRNARAEAAGSYDLSLKGLRAFHEWTKEWATLALQVLKPGGHLICFAAPRTYHRMACAVEDAGFEVRDQIMWLFGSGFPKSIDISKTIDKLDGIRESDKVEFGKYLRYARLKKGLSLTRLSGLLGKSSVHSWWEGKAGKVSLPVKPDYMELKRILGLDDRWDFLINRIEAKREVIGSMRGGKALKWYKNQPRSDTMIDITIPATTAAKQWYGWGSSFKPAHEPIVLARKPLSERNIAENALKHDTGAINIDGCRIGTGTGKTKMVNYPNIKNNNYARPDKRINRVEYTIVDKGRFPANLIHDGSDEVEAAFAKFGNKKTESPSRFFYCAKASRSERRDSRHPTVKPLSLMRYLCRLITPPNGTILDPFAGTGTTGEAAITEGFKAILIEQEAEYINDIKTRLEFALVP